MATASLPYLAVFLSTIITAVSLTIIYIIFRTLKETKTEDSSYYKIP
ncbi:MAG: hypothetical protein HGN29_06380 [Asgard group archaeon]|nr:hypothetical protein [Asgard group archaeon]